MDVRYKVKDYFDMILQSFSLSLLSRRFFLNYAGFYDPMELFLHNILIYEITSFMALANIITVGPCHCGFKKTIGVF